MKCPETSMKYAGVCLESDDDEEVHPNIDEKSFREWRRQQRQQKREELQKRLDEINAIDTHDENVEAEKKEIQEILKPRYVCVDSGSFTISESQEERDYSAELEHLVRNCSLDSFITMMDTKIIDMEEFECLVLHNLAEQIKEGNDFGGVILSKLSLYVRYARSHGREFLEKLRAQLTNARLKRQFEEDCAKDFEETKKMFLNQFGTLNSTHASTS
ncbi:putative Cdc37 chaperone [Ordospora pajunii]|uniref:putative Cdc37 chaperone n=1 Tax=Ordospora pajunii TaxID=3039483 RepID=UPI0029526A1C|nr:putative Cdc37 chaperone [Ordospora pajunii]KAH9411155.1 putative Cdc37 chaperone [Ordospora pajunii]